MTDKEKEELMDAIFEMYKQIQQQFPTPKTLTFVPPNPADYIEIDFVLEPDLKCECGGDKCNTTHSDWCPKYERT